MCIYLLVPDAAVGWVSERLGTCTARADSLLLLKRRK